MTDVLWVLHWLVTPAGGPPPIAYLIVALSPLIAHYTLES